MAFSPEHYLERASDLERAAVGVGNATIRACYLDLARTYRQLAEQQGASSDMASPLIHTAE